MSNPMMNKKHSASCFPKVPIASSGFWLQSSPLKGSLPLIMIQMTMIVGTFNVIHYFIGRRLSQPAIVSQILAGLLLGPLVLGRIEWVGENVYPLSSWIELNTVGMLCLMFFMFSIGVKTDLGMILTSGRKAAVIGIGSYFAPVTLVTGFRHVLRQHIPPEITQTGILNDISTSWSLSSFIVISCLLNELNLLNSKVGRLTMSATLIADFTCIVVDSLLTSIYLSQQVDTPVMGLTTFASFASLILFIVLVARPLTMWIIRRRMPAGGMGYSSSTTSSLDEIHFTGILILGLGCALISEVIGHHADVGMFLLGLALPSGPPVGSALVERLDAMVSGLGIPVFVAAAVYACDRVSITSSDLRICGCILFFLALSVTAKFMGVVVPALYCKVSPCDAISMGLIMTSKGIYEIKKLMQWQVAKSIDGKSYTTTTFFILGFTAATTPLIKVFYQPSFRYVTNKKRTIQHCSRHSAELRLLTCIHAQENVAPTINLLEALETSDGPAVMISVYMVHLTQLVGRAAAILAPYHCKTTKRKYYSSSSTASTSINVSDETDHIVNAFRHLEQNNPACYDLQPFISISPYASMHDDVCSLALEKKVSMVLLPFHQKVAIDGSIESMNQAIRTVNTNVLSYAPCSVAILVDNHDLSMSTNINNTALPRGRNELQLIRNNIAVYFLGGADDREALSLAMRMAENPKVCVTVLRFLPPDGWRDKGDEEVLDDMMMDEFRLNNTSGERVLYREEVVQDGEAMVTAIRSISKGFTLLIVGRGEGRENELTSGLSTWSEFPELGIIGDMLASTDFGARVSILVVQQQQQRGTHASTAKVPTSAGIPRRGAAEVNDILAAESATASDEVEHGLILKVN